MAGTIISTPATGAASWVDFITQQGATDTGYMRVSLTNFSGTVASAIATGSVLECAGSIYTFTETAISLASGTPSADVAVYYTVIPSAGGTTVSVVMDDTTPVWVDAKQGFYLSAASLTRVIGGAYIGTAATYYTKFIYTPQSVNECLSTNRTRPFLKTVSNIGEWNMDATISVDVSIPGNIHPSRIRDVIAIVKKDDNVYHYDLLTNNGTLVGGFLAIVPGSACVRLFRVTNGFFDDVDYNATASTMANRGWVMMEWEA